MDIDSTKLTVFFEAPFWVGVFECIEKGKLSVCKVTFGAEPKDYEVWEYLLKNYSRLHFSPSVETVVKKEAVNPKRFQAANRLSVQLPKLHHPATHHRGRQRTILARLCP